MITIDVMDFEGHEWQLLAPPLRWNRPKTELWLLVTNGSAPDSLRNFHEIQVPCFTEWWPADMTNERYRELNADQTTTLTPDEFDLGWHFCYDWDGLLVNAYDDEGEGSCCTCYRRKADIT